jgi:micrococcal nuclease
VRRILLLCVLALAACEPVVTSPTSTTITSTTIGVQPTTTQAPTTTVGSTGTVTRVSDGDTIVVGTTKVRLIGVDTPETVDPHRPDGCYGTQASDHTKALLPTGTPVMLVLDKDPTDRYGRTLAYVYRVADGLFINAELVQHGYAKASYFAPNGAHRAEFESLAAQAQSQRLGLWGAC